MNLIEPSTSGIAEVRHMVEAAIAPHLPSCCDKRCCVTLRSCPDSFHLAAASLKQGGKKMEQRLAMTVTGTGDDGREYTIPG